jgi:hypothetical protein
VRQLTEPAIVKLIVRQRYAGGPQGSRREEVAHRLFWRERQARRETCRNSGAIDVGAHSDRPGVYQHSINDREI